MTQSASYLLLTRSRAASGLAERLADRLASQDRPGPRAHATFLAHDRETTLELTAFEDIRELGCVLARRTELERGVSNWLAGDWRHEVLRHVEDVVPGTNALTLARQLELRFIEVPPALYAEYREWREGTIYEAVRRRPEITDFRSYHSAVSMRPGVTFVVGFDCDVKDYQTVYENDRYRSILREVGDRFIAGGLGNLVTEIFERRPNRLSLGAAA